MVVGRREPVTVGPGTPVAACLRAIQQTGTGDSVFVTDRDGRLAGVLTERDIFGSLPVVDDDRRLVGVVRQVDVLKFLAASFPEELLNLPPRPHQRMEQAEG